MPERVLARDEPKRKARLEPDVGAAWRWIGWLGLALALAGLGDLGLVWYPTAFGDPGWEFTTVTQSFAGLPLVTLGLLGMLGSGFARGQRWLVALSSVVIGVLGIAVVLALVLFLTDVPLALRLSEGPARTAIMKATAKTVGLGAVFSIVYISAAVTGVRRTLAKR